eukprot:CAMPEP_0117420252 /NCGR_PEP_ID=MMETSP0758-20121206/1622_1 /TAXON_ID=63605 /ORGANISM="Percolomonas cosmopolitus, Strain AE-1 (ATCC 50343)" /LENGTH=415 /DNA_ID=CAMNT_0005201747 /DNA_START=270 /DNA_END=1514 /DNA_ORIENTATION=-
MYAHLFEEATIKPQEHAPLFFIYRYGFGSAYSGPGNYEEMMGYFAHQHRREPATIPGSWSKEEVHKYVHEQGYYTKMLIGFCQNRKEKKHMERMGHVLFDEYTPLIIDLMQTKKKKWSSYAREHAGQLLLLEPFHYANAYLASLTDDERQGLRVRQVEVEPQTFGNLHEASSVDVEESKPRSTFSMDDVSFSKQPSIALNAFQFSLRHSIHWIHEHRQVSMEPITGQNVIRMLKRHHVLFVLFVKSVFDNAPLIHKVRETLSHFVPLSSSTTTPPSTFQQTSNPSTNLPYAFCYTEIYKMNDYLKQLHINVASNEDAVLVAMHRGSQQAPTFIRRVNDNMTAITPFVQDLLESFGWTQRRLIQSLPDQQEEDAILRVCNTNTCPIDLASSRGALTILVVHSNNATLLTRLSNERW